MQLVIIFFLINTINALKFILLDGEEKCFLEDIPLETKFSGKFKIELPDPDEFKKYGLEKYLNLYEKAAWTKPSAGSGIYASVFTPSRKPIFAKMFDSNGKIEFTPSVTGDYKICLKLQLSREKNEIYTGNNKKFAKISFKLYLGDDLSFYREKLELEQLTDLQAKTELLISNVRKIEKYQLMFRQNQEKFRDRAADVNNAVFWWGIFQLVVMIVAGSLQIKNLRTFFKEKKLV